jgi:P27 family predicted phage terminase small subunit
MAQKGKKPLPSNLKVLRGTLKSDDKPKLAREPKPRKGGVKPPDDVMLDKIATQEWNRITDELDYMGLLYACDRNQIAAYCAAFSVWTRGVRTLAGLKDLTLTSKAKGDGSVPRLYAHPAIAIVRSAAETMLRIAVEFGMTPSARVRVSAGKGKPDEPGGEKDEDFFD